jgi:3-deoxy-D-manno-octulosonate 8-phosphate phosphatase (KDO 8-P phosphatase)
MDHITKLAISVKLLLLDVDGVLTDGKLYFGNNGEELKAFNIYDGLGIKLLQRSGVQVGIVTGRQSQLVARRAADLGITIVVQGREDKLTAIHELQKQYPFNLTEIAYMGDDLPDLTAIQSVGLGMTVANASEVIKRQANWISTHTGGNGAVREACDLIMTAQGSLEKIVQQYSI